MKMWRNVKLYYTYLGLGAWVRADVNNQHVDQMRSNETNYTLRTCNHLMYVLLRNLNLLHEDENEKISSVPQFPHRLETKQPNKNVMALRSNVNGFSYGKLLFKI